MFSTCFVVCKAGVVLHPLLTCRTCPVSQFLRGAAPKPSDLLRSAALKRVRILPSELLFLSSSDLPTQGLTCLGALLLSESAANSLFLRIPTGLLLNCFLKNNELAADSLRSSAPKQVSLHVGKSELLKKGRLARENPDSLKSSALKQVRWFLNVFEK